LQKEVGYYKAFVSLWFEHGIYVRKEVCEDLGVNFNDLVGFELFSNIGRRCFTIETVKSIDEINPENEAIMMLSLFDQIANNHWYFLSEFGFTDKVTWKPRQYDYLFDMPAFEWLKENTKQYKTFKTIYNKIEERFLDFSMEIRGVVGLDLHELLREETEEEGKLKSEIIKMVKELTVEEAELFRSGIEKADVIIGSGSFFSSTLLPIETAFLVSDVDVGSFTLPLSPQREITVNPFLFYWLLSNIFQLENQRVIPCLLPISLASPAGGKVPIKKLKLKVYSPSKLCVEAFFNSEEEAKQWAKEKIFEMVGCKKHFTIGDFLLPFTAPSQVQKVELLSHQPTPFVDASPYGPIIYREGAVVPEITQGTDIEIEFFTNPLYDNSHPLLLDTNVISLMTFPYRPHSPFFVTFMENRDILIPAIVVYELKRKMGVGKERTGIIYALNRLYEMQAAGILKMKIVGEVLPELITVSDIGGKLKDLNRDFRDTLILLEAKKHNAVLFTNDKTLRKMAILIGIPSISYNSLLDDVEAVVYERKELRKSELTKIVKDIVQEIRGEEYAEEDIKTALNYLYFSGKIKIEGDFIKWVDKNKG